MFNPTPQRGLWTESQSGDVSASSLGGKKACSLHPGMLQHFPLHLSRPAGKLCLAQEQPVLQVRDSAPGPPVGFSIQTSWESTSHLDMMLREAWHVPSPLAVNRAGQSIQAPKQPWDSRGLGRLPRNKVAWPALGSTGLLQPCSPHALSAELLHPNQPNETRF